MRKGGVTFETVRRIGLAFPNTEEGTSYGTPALKVKGKLFSRLKEDGESIVIHMPFERRDDMMKEDPDAYYITDHYRKYPYMLVRLSKISEQALSDLLQGSYRAALASKRRKL
jgi:hypothetical protein